MPGCRGAGAELPEHTLPRTRQECRRLKPARSEVRGLAARVNSCPDTRLCRRLKPVREGQGGLVGTTERQLKESPKRALVPPAEANSGGETKGLDAGLRASSTRPPLGLIASCWRPAKRAAWSAALFELSSSRPYRTCTFSACQPLGPLTTLNETAWPSCKLRKPLVWIAE